MIASPVYIHFTPIHAALLFAAFVAFVLWKHT